MKKFISLLLSLCFLLCFVGCENDETPTEDQNSTPSTTTSTPTESNPDQSTESNSSIESVTESAIENNSTPDTTSKDDTPSQVTPSKPSTPSTPSEDASVKQNALNSAKKKADQGLYLDAMKILKDYLVSKNDAGVKSSLTEYTDKYVEQQIKLAESKFITPSKDYAKAIEIINGALQNANNSEKLLNKKKYYQEFAPLYLSDIEPYKNTTWFKTYDSVNDIFGTTHKNCIRIEKNFTKADGTYNLDRKYNTLSFTIFGLGDGNSGTLKIYADGECIYSNTNIDVNTRPIDVTLDITGILDLKFEMYQDYNSYIGECFGLANVTIQKTVK